MATSVSQTCADVKERHKPGLGVYMSRINRNIDLGAFIKFTTDNGSNSINNICLFTFYDHLNNLVMIVY